ncbi:hypothetical protein BGZ59_007314, partial [Podila verticillata]
MTPTPHNHHWSPESSPRAPLPPPPTSNPLTPSSSLSSKPDTLYSSSSSSSIRPKGDHLFITDHESGPFSQSNAGSNASLNTLNSPVASSSVRSLPFLKHHHHHHQHSSSTGGSGGNGNGSGGSSGSRHGKHSSKDEHGHRRHDAPEPIRPSIQQTVNSIPSMMDQGGKGNRLEPMMTMQDWLQKRSTSLQLVWKRRWCILRDDRLIFYRSTTDTKPIGALHLAEYHILASGPDISRKSKLAFRLSSEEPIPHQHQHHVFYTESPQALQVWLQALQAHISHARAVWLSMATSSSTGHTTEQKPQFYGADGTEGQSIIDKVLDRLHIDEAPTDSPDPRRLPGSSPATSSYIPYIPPNFPQSHENNNDTWSSTSSMPNTSTNTSSNLEYIFALQQQQAKASMDSIREHDASSDYSTLLTNGTPLGSYAEQTLVSSNLSDTSNDPNRSSLQSMEYQGRPSMQQSRGPHLIPGNYSHHSQSPNMGPVRSSGQSTMSIDNGVVSPSTSAAGSPYSSPTLTSQHHTLNSNTIPPLPGTLFYRVNDGPSSRSPPSIGSSTSISTIASSGDVSTINDLGSENSLGMSDSGQGKASSVTSQDTRGNTLLGMVTGKHKKDKDRSRHGSSASSNHSGSGSGSSSGIKLFSGSGVCMYSGCTQLAKTCSMHNKKHRAGASKSEKQPEKESKKSSKKLWPMHSDKSSQVNLTVGTTNLFKGHGLPSPSFSGSLKSGRGLSSKSMVSLPRDSENSSESSSTVPLPASHLLSVVTSPARKRSPSVSVIDDALFVAQQHQILQHHHNSDPILPPVGDRMRSQTPPPSIPSQTLPAPPPPPRSASTVPSGQHNKQTFNLNSKMGLQVASDFGSGPALDSLAGTTLNGNFFVANHHRTMQKLQALQPWKNLPTGPLPPPPGKS